MLDRYAEVRPPVFADIQKSRPALSRRALLTSLAGHLLVILALLGIRSESPSPEPARPHPVLIYTELASPPRILAPKAPIAPKPRPALAIAAPRPAPRPHLAESRPIPAPEPPPAPPTLPPRVTITLPEAASAAPKPVKRSGPPVQLGSFSSPVVEKVTLARVPASVGAFAGAVDASAKPSRDAVSTGGFGEATATRAGRRGAAGTTGASGFGDAVALAQPAASGTVQRGGFESAQAVATAKTSAQPAGGAAESPVAILDKPRPAYTEEARQLKIEGEVLLELLFDASGKAHVLRVIRGLGHGLDESAVRSAENIRFRPALRGGAPVDSTAVARIVFQLAY